MVALESFNQPIITATTAKMDDLPNEILLNILWHLTAWDGRTISGVHIPIIARVCQRWHNAAFDLYIFGLDWFFVHEIKVNRNLGLHRNWRMSGGSTIWRRPIGQ